MLLPALLNVASPGGERARLSVLVLHRVLPQPDPMFPEALDAIRFAQMCGWIAKMFNTLPLPEAVRLLKAGRLPRRALAITFDDGYADNLHVAEPILSNAGLTATFFIATGYLDGGCMWNDRVIESFRLCRMAAIDLRDLLGNGSAQFVLHSARDRRIALEAVVELIKYLPAKQREQLTFGIARQSGVLVPSDLMLGSGELRELHRRGMQIGAHTVTHPILASLDRQQMRDEMAQSKAALEQLLQEPVNLFAYPNGKPGQDFDATGVELARALGFEAALTTVCGAATRQTDPYQLPRFTPWDRTGTRFGLRMLTTLLASRHGCTQLGSTSA